MVSKTQTVASRAVPDLGCSCVFCGQRSQSACSDTGWPAESEYPSVLRSSSGDAVPSPIEPTAEKDFLGHLCDHQDIQTTQQQEFVLRKQQMVENILLGNGEPTPKTQMSAIT